MKIEKEYKLLIDEVVYNQILATFSGFECIEQVNHYYDIVPSIPNIAIRIRETNNIYIFTLKHFDKVLYEYEFEVNDLSLNDDSINQLLNKFKIDKLVSIGSMTTRRSILKDQYGEFCIDKSEYNGLVDYEIEYELFDDKDDLVTHFNEWLKPFNLHYVSSGKSKIHRFKESL